MSDLTSDYQIRSAQLEDLAKLAEIERAAATLFGDTPYAFLVDAEPLSIDFITQQFRSGRVWVAVDRGNICMGFAIANDVDGNAYLQEIDVCPNYGRRGIGRALIERVCLWAKSQNYNKILLSTFLDIEWNAPFYLKCGFHILAEDKLTIGFQQIRAKEAEAGLPIDRRGILYRELYTRIKETDPQLLQEVGDLA